MRRWLFVGLSTDRRTEGGARHGIDAFLNSLRQPNFGYALSVTADADDNTDLIASASGSREFYLEPLPPAVSLEILPSGQFEPLYRTMLDVKDGELPILPLSVYGEIAMAHCPDSSEYSSPSQFFFISMTRELYVTAGREILSQLETGDTIQSARLLQGQDRLILSVSSN